MNDKVFVDTNIFIYLYSVENDQKKLLQFFGTWDDEDVNCMAEIIKEREKFSLGRAAI